MIRHRQFTQDDVQLERNEFHLLSSNALLDVGNNISVKTSHPLALTGPSKRR